jgi:hypothetical protein
MHHRRAKFFYVVNQLVNHVAPTLQIEAVTDIILTHVVIFPLITVSVCSLKKTKKKTVSVCQFRQCFINFISSKNELLVYMKLRFTGKKMNIYTYKAPSHLGEFLTNDTKFTSCF